MSPLVSVLIATFNRKNLLENAIKSVLNQNYKNYEIIISDDNSNDDTAEFCKALCEKFKNIFYTKNTKYKSGPNGNKNNALDSAKGEFIMFLDDDDELLQNAIETLVAQSKKGYSHILANCLIKKDGVLTKEFSGKGLDSDCELSKKDFLMGKFYGEFLSIFKKDLLGEKRFDDEIWGIESTLWVNLYSEKTFYIHKPLRIYTKSENSVTASAADNAKGVYLGYLALAQLLEAEFAAIKDKDYKRQIALNYKMAAYYAKFAKMPKKMLKCLAKSISTKPTKQALLMLCVCFAPRGVLKKLSSLRARLCKS